MSPIVVPVIALVAYLLTPTPLDRIVLLPSADGTPAALVLKSARGEAVLDRPYAAADISSNGAMTSAQSNSEEVGARFGSALAAQPPRPVSWLVQFVSGRDELTPESKSVLEHVKAELTRRPAPEISVIGHTDRGGTVEFNDALSIKRAQFVRDALVGAGIDARQIEISGRGKREPLAAGSDAAAEARNRRVEINVR